jgi:hypothetical protein
MLGVAAGGLCDDCEFGNNDSNSRSSTIRFSHAFLVSLHNEFERNEGLILSAKQRWLSMLLRCDGLIVSKSSING